MSPVDRAGRRLARVRFLPLVEVHHAVAAVDFDNRRDERDDVIADVPDVRAVVDGEPIGELHERRRRARFGRMDGARDVVDRRRPPGDVVGQRVVHLHRARIGELREVGFVRIQLRHERLGRHGDGDHLAPFFGRTDRVDLRARRRLREQPHVVVHLFRVRQLPRSAGDVAERRFGRRHGLRRRQIVDERRQEEGLGRVLLDSLRVLFVDRLVRVAAGPSGREIDFGRRGRRPGALLLRGLDGHRKDRRGCREHKGQHQSFRKRMAVHEDLV